MDTNFKYEVMRYIEQCNKNPYNTSGIKKRYNLMHLQLSRDTAQDISICLKGCGTCVCNPIPNHELRFLRSLKHNSLQLLIHASCTTFYERTFESSFASSFTIRGHMACLSDQHGLKPNRLPADMEKPNTVRSAPLHHSTHVPIRYRCTENCHRTHGKQALLFTFGNERSSLYGSHVLKVSRLGQRSFIYFVLQS